MQTLQVPLESEPGFGVGLSWFLGETPVGTVVQHDGGTFGQTSILQIIPSQSFGFAVLTNSLNGPAVFSAAFAEAAKQYFDFDAAGAGGSDLKAKTLTPEQLAEYAGIYRVPSDQVSLTISEGRLVFKHEQLELAGQQKSSIASPLPTAPVDFVDEDEAIVGGVESPLGSISFLRRPDGSVSWLRFGARLFPKAN
jgi:hypothetical protein